MSAVAPDVGSVVRPRPVHIPHYTINFRKPIPKVRRGPRRFMRRGGRNCESVPYPQAADGLVLQGLLVGSQVFLYDMVTFRFLRQHRGHFGEAHRFKVYERGVRAPFGESDGSKTYDPETDSFPPPAHIQPVGTLNLFEAYFLSIVTNCLRIWDGSSGMEIDPRALMGIFMRLHPLFPYFFAAYCHFRRLKYVVTSGVKFGTDFVLYEYGPSKTHSLYMAYIVIPGLRDPSLNMVDTLQRVANAAKKDALLVRVTTDAVSEQEIATYDSFVRMKITELIVRRRERIFDKPMLETTPQYVPPYRNLQALAGKAGTEDPAPLGNGSVDAAGVNSTRRQRPQTFHFPTVFMGVRRVFRGRLWTGPTRGAGASSLGFGPAFGYQRTRGPPMFVSRNSSSYRPVRVCGRGARFWRR
ncbi:uncharacterized protein LOC129596252 [Paramacrobiotus metropolitanus]|uniref:uncharacterized protein LOC129596252 n=1 Tax=Paramacrobiotus metropolitanus TaxID=2943436 RepID=UPI0024460C4E|nr:uncharacterized protein LOC129596252 [Paramacrobiotus metropolitanus]XP_055349466.1 uncharacterized protein LOC129596252 [Paramacrobiotus metropolitanus]XP_055349475.1 uncharacterized protein LOC129596252 [Paramacrobiotus metropolitanus]